MSIREVGSSGERKTREGGERRGRTLGQEGWARVKCRELGSSHYGAKIYDVELGASHSGAEPPGRSSTVPRSPAPASMAPS